MPLFSTKKQDNEVHYKQRLERKLYLAREDPEPIFDLSECNLKSVPSGTFILCKVLRKESLNLKDNKLSDLKGGGKLQDLSELRQLNLNYNALKVLSTHIGYLRNLKELFISHNQLTCLPEEIGQLQLLQTLDVSYNCLTKVPTILSQLPSLKLLDIRSNNISNSTLALPSTCQILADSSVLPDNKANEDKQKVTCIGKSEIMKQSPSTSKTAHGYDKTENEAEKLLSLLEARRKKQEELIKRLASFEEEQRCTLATVLEHQQEQKNLVRQIAQCEEDNLTALSGVMMQGEARNSELTNIILHDEQAQQEILREILKKEDSKNIELTKALAQEEEAQRTRLAKILSAVPEKSDPLVQLVLQDEQLQLSVLEAVRSRQLALSGQLSRSVVDEEQIRQAALAAIREKGDEQARNLANEVAKVQSQLSAVTAKELKKKADLNSDALNELGQHRVLLSATLSSLVEQQSSRRRQLLEEVSNQMEGASETLWLCQLHKLLDAPPENLKSEIVGITDLVTNITISKNNGKVQPSAPPLHEMSEEFLDIYAPSAPTISAIECSICMNAQCGVVFLPCGHVCSCQGCSVLLIECPLCRQEIHSKIPLALNW